MALDAVTVLHVASGDLWGGAEALVAALARAQKSAGLFVSAAILNPGKLADELRGAQIPVTQLDESRQGFGALLRELKMLVHDTAPAIIHSHRQKENMLSWLASIAAPRRPRLVATVHGLPEPVLGVDPLRRGLVRLGDAATMRFGVDATVAVSHDIASRLRQARQIRRVTTIHNGIELAQSVAPRANGEPVPTAPRRLLAMGRLVPIKRYERLGPLLDALNGASNTDFRLTLAGDGPLDASLRTQLATQLSQGRLEMLGHVANVAPLLDYADGLVITSDHEGIPMVALEALSRGVPVFGFDVGGLSEIAATHSAMRLTSPFDTRALAACIARFFAESDGEQRFPPPANWPFDIRRCAENYLKLYHELLQR